MPPILRPESITIGVVTKPKFWTAALNVTTSVLVVPDVVPGINAKYQLLVSSQFELTPPVLIHVLLAANAEEKNEKTIRNVMPTEDILFIFLLWNNFHILPKSEFI